MDPWLHGLGCDYLRQIEVQPVNLRADVLVPVTLSFKVGVVLDVHTALDVERGLVSAWVLAGYCLPDFELHM